MAPRPCEKFSDMWHLTLSDWSGILSVVLAVTAYAALQTGYIRGTGYTYPGLNLISAVLMLFSLWANWNGSAFAVEVLWIVISVLGIARIYFINSRLNFSDEEMTLISYGLPRMSRATARALLNKGVWMDAPPGTVLTTEGHSVTHLHFMLHGAAKVLSGGANIATIKRGFIGEMAVMDAAPASATVETAEPSRIFTVSGTALRALIERDVEFAGALSKHLADATKQKLIEANARLSAHEKAHPPVV